MIPRSRRSLISFGFLPLLCSLLLSFLFLCNVIHGGAEATTTITTTTSTTILLPRDIAFDEKARLALQELRRQQLEKQVEEKKNELDNCGNNHHVTLTLVGYKGGTLDSQINQDRATIVLGSTTTTTTTTNKKKDKKSLPWILLGVFDGHGRFGEIVSEYTVSELPKILQKKLEEWIKTTTNRKNDNDHNHEESNFITKTIQDAFIHLDKTVPTNGMGGCTASIVFEYNSNIYIANAGDSISLVASYHPNDDTVHVLYVTREDKPHLLDERKRIEEEYGGTVYIPQDLEYESSRVLSGQTGLAMSRSIGDWDMKGVIALPIVKVLNLQELLKEAQEMCGRDDDGNSEDDDQKSCSLPQFFAVSATDGLMDYIKPDELADAFATAFYRPSSPMTGTTTGSQQQHPFTTAEDLILLAAKGWNEEMGGQYRDDIAISASKLGTSL